MNLIYNNENEPIPDKSVGQNHDLSKYYASYNIFAFANGMFGIFINIFLFTKFNLISVVFFQASIQITQTMMFVVSGYIMRFSNARTLFSIGTISRSLIIFAIIFVRGPLYEPFIFGLIYGIPSGIFWAGNNTLSQAITKNVNRFNFISINSTLSSIAGLISPFIAGVIVTLSPGFGMDKYEIDFAISAVLLILSGGVALAIKEKGERKRAFKFQDTIIADPKYRNFKIYFFLSNIFTIVISIFVPIYIFYLTRNYVITGLIGTFSALINVIGNISSVYLHNFLKRNYLGIIGGIIISSFLFIINNSFEVILVFLGTGIITFLMVPLNNEIMSRFMNFLDQIQYPSIYWINREYYLVYGRMLSFAIMSIVSFLSISIFSYVYILPPLSLSVLGFLRVLKPAGN